MFRSPPTTLRRSRFFVLLRATGLLAVLSAWPFAAFAQSLPAGEGESPNAGAPVVHAADPAAAAVAASGAEASNGFDAQQKALDARKAENDYRYGVAVHRCYDKFFVNACVTRARDRMRAVQATIHAEQLSLDDARRASRAQERDAREAIEAARNAAEAPQREAADARNAETFEQKQRQHALDEARRNAEAPQRAENQAAYDRKQADFQRKLDDARRQAAQDAQERAQRAQRFSEKQSEAEQHKADVEARQKQAAQRAQQKQQDELQQQEQQKQLQKEQQDSN